ncbi:MAG TPA: hypothetical protein VH601_11085 [Bryobacteraceae bacterium]|jgi:hypothetical protein
MRSVHKKKLRAFHLPALAALLVLPASFAPAQMQTLPAQMQTVTTPPVDAVAITVTRLGPYPNTVTHTNTPFVLDVSNRSGLLEDAYSLLPAVQQSATPQNATQESTGQQDAAQQDPAQQESVEQNTAQQDTAQPDTAQADTTQQDSAPQNAAPQPSVPHLLDLHSTQTQQHDHQTIQLAPGNYQLQFQSHPDWVVNITITAN